VKYQWQKQNGDTWVNIGSEIPTSGTVTGAGYSITAITSADAGAYRVLVNGRSDKQVSDAVVLRVGLPAAALIVYQWDDVPAINCNALSNGGYTFVEFQWLRNGQEIAGATKPYIQIPAGTTDTYTCLLTTSDGRPLAVCPFAPAPAPASALLAYPNPVVQGQSLRLQTTGMEGAVANIYSMNGSLVKGNIPIAGTESTIDISGMMQGMYVLQVVKRDGTRQTINIVVE
jgi:hypothetical protein